jgi:hypothetical protein
MLYGFASWSDRFVRAQRVALQLLAEPDATHYFVGVGEGLAQHTADLRICRRREPEPGRPIEDVAKEPVTGQHDILMRKHNGFA